MGELRPRPLLECPWKGKAGQGKQLRMASLNHFTVSDANNALPLHSEHLCEQLFLEVAAPEAPPGGMKLWQG